MGPRQLASKQPIPIRKLVPGTTATISNQITLAKPLPTKIQRDDAAITSGLTDNTFGRQAVDDESLSMLGSVNTYDTIHSDQGSTPSQTKFLPSKQKLQQEFKAIHPENQKEKLKLRAQVAALQAQLFQQALPGSSTAPTGPIDHG